MKFCGACDRIKPWSAFRTKGSSDCRSCQERAAQRKRNERESFDYRRTRRWSALDDARLLTLDAIGVPFAAIAVLIDRPVSGVDARLTLLSERLFQPRRVEFNWTPARIAELREMIAVQRLSRSKAGAQLGVSKNSVIRAAQRYLPELCVKKSITYTKCQQARVGI